MSNLRAWMVLTACLFLGLLASLVYIARLDEVETGLDEKRFAAERDSLQAVIDRLQARIPATESRVLDPYTKTYLAGKGLTEPVAQIKGSVLEQNGLIPHHGVLGGKMRFVGGGEVWILGRKWVLATFEDGHVRGKALLAFAPSEDGTIAWRLIDSYVEE